MTPDTITPDTSVGEIARLFPFGIGTFERLGIDYCCGGRRSLRAACERASADPAEVLREIQSSNVPASSHAGWDTMTMTELCDNIEATHHRLARALLERLHVLLPKIAGAHAAAHPEFAELARVGEGLRDDMLEHMVREERVLFPWLRRLERPEAITLGPPWSVRRPIDCMVHDHDDVGAALDRMRSLTAGLVTPEGACRSVEAAFACMRELDRDTRLHIHKENNVLFPAGVDAERRRTPAGPRPECIAPPAPAGESAC